MDLTFPLRSAFLALPLEKEAKLQFQAIQESLKPFADFLSFQDTEQPHLTLSYWSELLEIEYQPIVDQARTIAARTAPFSLRVTGAETFGKTGDERVLFLAVSFSPELATLKKLCPWPSPYPAFHPHITLARIRHPQRFTVHKKKVMKALGDASFEIGFDRLRFYAEAEGVKQTPLEEFLFQRT